MATMYDKLGDLLNETLEAGAVKFVRIERDFVPPPEDGSPEQRAGAGPGEEGKGGRPSEGRSAAKPKEAPPGRAVIYKKLTPELERSYRLLDITVSATVDDVKKAYKEKLKYFHPDRYAGNVVLEKVATDKTRDVVKAYGAILEFLQA